MRRMPLWGKAPVVLALALIGVLSVDSIRLRLQGALVASINSSIALISSELRNLSTPFGLEPVAGALDPLALLKAASIEEEIVRETRWLIACQMRDGAIAQTPLGDKIVPYFANFAAKTLVDIEPERARSYMTWYLDHLNRPDRFGLAGTVYDYELSSQGWLPTLNYDSADSYAATFLSLASYYLTRTGDHDFIESNLADIDLVAGVLLALQDTDGLTFVAPGSGTKYLMDNCEVYRGLMDWAEALLVLGRPEDASRMVLAAENVRLGIEHVFYSAYRGQYAHTVSWYGKRYPKPGKWYPDAVSQLYVITEGVLRTDDQRAYRIWSNFNEQFPAWSECGAYDGFPWAKIALASVKMRDTDRAGQFLAWVAEEFGRRARPYPWYVLESAHILDLYGAMYLTSSDADPEANLETDSEASPESNPEANLEASLEQGGQSSPETPEVSRSRPRRPILDEHVALPSLIQPAISYRVSRYPAS